MKRTSRYFAAAAFGLVLLALPSVASAQWRDRDRDDDYYGNGRYGYGRNIRGTIESLRNRARNFERQVDRVDDRRDDRQDDRWGRNRGDRYDNLDVLAQRFRRATEDLRKEYGNGRNLNNSRDEAQRVLDLGSQIEYVIGSSRGGRRGSGGYIQNEWYQISSDLRIIADVYGYNYQNRGGYNRNGSWRNRVPFPLPF
ncbi:MAG: hypothetical protein ACK4S4_03865 [Pyrinomonadaceae bacterium]